MSYIFLSFSKHLDKASNSKNEFYKLSLNDQFNLLQKRIPFVGYSWGILRVGRF